MQERFIDLAGFSVFMFSHLHRRYNGLKLGITEGSILYFSFTLILRIVENQHKLVFKEPSDKNIN